MLENQFADDSGNLYKPEGEAATWSFFEEESFDKKTNEDEADWSDIIAAVDALNENTTNASQWRSNLEEVFNVEAFLRCLAVNQVIVNWDSYGVMDHNYYVYGDPSDNGRLAWFPWDLNESMLLTGMNSSVASSIMLDDIEDEWPLIRYLLDDEVYREAYLEEVKAFLDGPFDTALVHEQLDAAHNLIAPYVVGTEATEAEPYTFLRNAAEFEDSLTDNREGLKPHVEERYEYARSILASE
jgi:hypothetical protein